jgi:hypothetical protein
VHPSQQIIHSTLPLTTTISHFTPLQMNLRHLLLVTLVACVASAGPALAAEDAAWAPVDWSDEDKRSFTSCSANCITHGDNVKQLSDCLSNTDCSLDGSLGGNVQFCKEAGVVVADEECDNDFENNKGPMTGKCNDAGRVLSENLEIPLCSAEDTPFFSSTCYTNKVGGVAGSFCCSWPSAHANLTEHNTISHTSRTPNACRA